MAESNGGQGPSGNSSRCTVVEVEKALLAGTWQASLFEKSRKVKSTEGSRKTLLRNRREFAWN